MPNPLSQEDIDRQQERLVLERARLADLLRQESQHGAAWAPPAIVGGMREARANITGIKQVLRTWGVTVADHPDDAANATGTVDTQAPLFALPLDRIPDPAPLPAGSRMPLSRNPHFVGREHQLKA